MMNSRLPNGLTFLAVGFCLVVPGMASPPWKENTPIVQVQKEVYAPRVKQNEGRWVWTYYVGPGLTREETFSRLTAVHLWEERKRRRSTDNGRSWSDFEPMPDLVTHPDGVRVYWGRTAYPQACDPTRLKGLVSVWLRQTTLGGHHNHCFARISRDNGLTWGEPKLLRYEDGADFDPNDPCNKSFLKNNRCYPGSNILRHSNGTLIFPAGMANDPDTPNRRQSSLCFIGEWNAVFQDYFWTAGDRVTISPELSRRGLMEPNAQELKDGRVLVIWRGSNTETTPGRKWFSVSTDGGRSLSEVKELKYDDGSSFYSPSSIHKMIRHSVSGKLYWVGNISAEKPNGNFPRYPLVIAEVEETIPALKRNTVTVIDDRQEGEWEKLRLSNFSLLENRETHALEVFLCRMGAEKDNFWGGDAYKYTLTFPTPVPEPAPLVLLAGGLLSLWFRRRR